MGFVNVDGFLFLENAIEKKDVQLILLVQSRYSTASQPQQVA